MSTTTDSQESVDSEVPTSKPGLETFSYDDGIVRQFALATLVWGFVGTLAGVIVAILLILPNVAMGWEFLSFGRLRPLHTNAAIFAFAGNAVFTAVYYSTQRLCKCRMWSSVLSQLHFWGWQAIIVAAAITLPLGFTQGKEYAELEWPIDIAIAVVWLVFFGGNFFMTLLHRRERHIYVALWFYIATIVTVTVLHVFNNLAVPAGWFKSYSLYAGVQDAFMQWWYGHNAVAFFLTTPFLGLMYYFLPKAANRPVYSYRLSILHFWSLVFIYIWAGPHHLHYTALPEWASTLGMLFSVMLWMPSWGGMINGLLTLRGTWHKVAEDPVLKFFVVGITFYGMSTFEGPLLSVKSVNALSHYTDWTIAHVHSGALGWNGFMTFGMIYWLLPRIFQTKLWSQKLATWHFWSGTIAIILYIVPLYFAGILNQGLAWRELDPVTGSLVYPDFVELVNASYWAWCIRVLAGVMYVSGVVMLGINYLMTWLSRPARYEEPVYQAAPLTSDYQANDPQPKDSLEGYATLGMAKWFDAFLQLNWHRKWERLPMFFTVMVTLSVIVASLFEIIPTFVIRSNVPTIETVTPYTPLELAGRDIYVAEGCYNCHSQMVRPLLAETKRFGDYSLAGEFVYDHPFQWGSRRIGPDLAREGGKQSDLWHLKHFEEPTDTSTGSVMPSYKHLVHEDLNLKAIVPRVEAMEHLGIEYNLSPEEIEAHAAAQAEEVAARIVQQGGPAFMYKKTIIALIAYMQRLGVDRYKTPPPAEQPEGEETEESAEQAPETETAKLLQTTTQPQS